MQVNAYLQVASNSSQNIELTLQESCTDKSGSLIVYTTVDVDSIQLAMNGEDPSIIPLLPIGFVILPAGPTSSNEANINNGDHANMSSTQHEGAGPDSGCLLTVGLQVLASSIASAKLNLASVTAINNHLCNVVNHISTALSIGGSVDNGSCTEPPVPPKQ